jgi:hypothetical protein
MNKGLMAVTRRVRGYPIGNKIAPESFIRDLDLDRHRVILMGPFDGPPVRRQPLSAVADP